MALFSAGVAGLAHAPLLTQQTPQFALRNFSAAFTSTQNALVSSDYFAFQAAVEFLDESFRARMVQLMNGDYFVYTNARGCVHE